MIAAASSFLTWSCAAFRSSGSFGFSESRSLISLVFILCHPISINGGFTAVGGSSLNLFRFVVSASSLSILFILVWFRGELYAGLFVCPVVVAFVYERIISGIF